MQTRNEPVETRTWTVGEVFQISPFNRAAVIAALLFLLFAAAASAQERVRVKDLAGVSGADVNEIEGVGLVTGLPGTGDSPDVVRARLRSFMQNRDGVLVSDKEISARNVAVVAVTARLEAFQAVGTEIDVMVATLNDAKNLKNGLLTQTFLYGPRPYQKDPVVYAIARGALAIGADVNTSTVATIPGGAIIQRLAPQANFLKALDEGWLTLKLNSPDFNVATRVADAINARFPALYNAEGELAAAQDAGHVRVKVATEKRGEAGRGDAIQFVGEILGMTVEIGSQEEPEATVIINEREKTYAITGKVRVLPCRVQKGRIVIEVPGRAEAGKSRPADGVVLLNDVLDTLGPTQETAADVIDLIKLLHNAGALKARLIVR
ncbi:MAG: flagellar basal body P-ring protein FlgI [Planctomycetes bacterium]|nr:flagellar basal body P-ring protein FlgI [Planctomycetota bacterium]